jgi:hypothetical protein
MHFLLSIVGEKVVFNKLYKIHHNSFCLESQKIFNQVNLLYTNVNLFYIKGHWTLFHESNVFTVKQ